MYTRWKESHKAIIKIGQRDWKKGDRVPNYTIVQGDHLSVIAAREGFRDYQTIWQHPNNSDLRDKRPNPHVLYPGDILFIPDKQPKVESIPTTKVSPFVVPSSALKLRLVLKDFDGQPMPNLACELTAGGATYNLTSDSDGLIEAAIPPTAQDGVLKVADLDLEMPVKIGYLDPNDEDSGWQARLTNLGYLSNLLNLPDDETRFAHALEEFQCDQGLNVTGQPDDATKDKLKELHGA